MPPGHRLATAALTVAVLTSAVAAQPSLRERLLAVEDARDASTAGVEVLRQGLASRDAGLRRAAVRALGRFERADLIALVAPLLADADAGVRREAANAAGQSATTADAVADVHDRLLRRLRAERDPATWGVVAATLGRLRYERSGQVAATEQALARVLPRTDTGEAARPGDALDASRMQVDAVLGAVKGLESLVRQSRKLLAPSTQTVGRLRAAALTGGETTDERVPRIRRLAWQALASAEQVDDALVEAGLADEDGEVRRLAMVATGGDAGFDARDRLLRRGLGDAHAPARYEALRAWGRHLQQVDCEPVSRAIDDPDPHLSLLAIDLAGSGCATGAPPVARLAALAGELPPAAGAWHRPAHALVSLARVSPDRATPLAPRFAAHGQWQVRMYTARAAAALEDFAQLTALARDSHDNVREAALGQLIALERPEAVPLAIEALSRPDYQLVRTAARALADRAHRADAVPALLEALARITAEKRDTSRDPRMAILDALGELGWPDGAGLTAAQVQVVASYRLDFDRRVAARAAELLQAWTMAPQASQPQPPAAPRVPLAEIDALAGARARIVMAGRGTFELRFLVDEAPFTVHRVVTLARRGYYDGLTFHRVVPNFVIQGGSPGANEYVGDGPYMRDEVGLVSHRRATVGISTRGRDTGDAQIFVNLVDLPRLDHAYTVFAEVTRGMEVVDGILEGDLIERFEILPQP